MATGTIILRPSADVSLGHSVYPNTLSAGYLAINEEVCDNDATELRVSTGGTDSSASVSDTSRFALSGVIPNEKIQVTSMRINAYCRVTGDKTYEGSNTYGFAYNDNAVMDTASVSLNKSEYALCSATYEETSSLVSEFNYILLDYGIIPDLVIKTTAIADGGSSKGSVSSTAYVSQVYIEIDYTTDFVSAFGKYGSVWKRPKFVYKRQNGVWEKIPQNEYAGIFQSNLLIDKCKCRGHIEVPAADIAATCLETGMTGGIYCSYCGTTLKEHDTVQPALGHNETALADTKATCTADGMTGGTKCSRCGITLKEHDTVIPALGHNEVAMDGTATCTADGMTGGTKCSRCGITLKEHDIVQPALGHDFNQYTGKCSRCTVYHENSFTFTIQRNTQTSATTYYSMPNLTWGNWTRASAFWFIDADGRIYHSLLNLKYYIDNVTKDDLIIAGHAYTATDNI